MADNNSKQPEKGVPAELNQDRFVGRQDLTRWSPLGQRLAKLMHWIALRIGAHLALIITLLVGGVLAVGLTSLFAWIYDAVTEADGVAGLDHPLLNYVMSIRSPWLDSAVTAYTNLGGTIGMPILAIAVMALLAIRRRSWTPVILIGSAALGSLLMTIAGKQLFGRSRPPLSDAVPPFEYSPSFPSGHSLNSFVIAGIIAYLIVLRRKTATGRVVTISLAALFAVTMGLTRVFLGHHWFTDVLGAWVLGAAWLAIVITAHRLYLTSRKRGSRDRPVVPTRRVSARG
ncbi:MAG: phosphatidic acid phosphatase [Microbacteriaceae bacterium]|nr:phosphatidic acid phosphatase [Microbacteriaceae bacterium]